MPCEQVNRQRCLKAVTGNDRVLVSKGDLHLGVNAGRAEDLPTLLPSLLFSAIVPFVGPERASAESDKVRRLT